MEWISFGGSKANINIPCVRPKSSLDVLLTINNNTSTADDKVLKRSHESLWTTYTNNMFRGEGWKEDAENSLMNH